MRLGKKFSEGKDGQVCFQNCILDNTINNDTPDGDGFNDGFNDNNDDGNNNHDCDDNDDKLWW